MMLSADECARRVNETKRRLKTWWAREETDRPLFMMFSTRNLPAPNDYFSNVEESWLNIDKRLAYEELRMECTTLFGEQYPGVSASLGPGSLALLIGSPPGFFWDTVWYGPCFDDIATANIKRPLDTPYWTWTLDYTRAAIKRAAGRYMVELPDLIENFDTLASVCGMEELMMSALDEPEAIHRLQRQTLDAWKEAFEAIYALIKDEENGMSVGGFNLWAPGTVAKLQCDASVMLSKGMFDDFVAPYLKEQAAYLDYALYHLDGPNALQHFDTILGMKEIKAVQWQPGSAYPAAIDPAWFDVQKRILDSGKSLLIFVKPGDEETLPQRLEAFVREIGHRGVAFVIEQNLKDERTAQTILEAAPSWR